VTYATAMVKKSYW